MAESEQESSGQDLSRVPPQLRSSVFKPGQSGNPGGAPKGVPLTIGGVLKLAMQEGGVESAVSSALTVLRNPNHKHWLGTFREVMDRTEGKVADRIQHELKRFEEGIELRDGRDKTGPVPLPRVISQPSELEGESSSSPG